MQDFISIAPAPEQPQASGPRPAASGVSPFGDPAFLSCFQAHLDAHRQPLNEAEPGYLRLAFRQRRIGPLRLVEAVGARVGDFLEVDATRLDTAGFAAFLRRQAGVAAGMGRPQAHLLTFPRLLADGPTAATLEATASAHGLPLYHLDYEQAGYVALEGDWDTYLARQLSSSSRSKFRRKARRLTEQGLRFEHHTTPEAVAAHLPEAIALYARRADTAYRGPLWLQPDGQAFLHAWSQRLATDGQLDLTLMYVDDRPLAFCLGLHNHVDYFHYATAFDPDPAYRKHSPGILLTMHLIERAFAQGFRRFDFLMGLEPYKRPWVTHQRTIRTYVLATRGVLHQPMARAYLASLHLRQTVRTSPRLRPLAERLLNYLQPA